jgi:sigma-70-like protein
LRGKATGIADGSTATYPLPRIGSRSYRGFVRERMPVHDREGVAAIVSGDADGLAAAFDQYAPGLYAYCRSQLTESADAADAIRDTIIIASSRVSGLSEPDRLRAWLYAVARNECQRRLRAAGPSAALYESAEAMDDTGTMTAVSEQTELRAQVRDITRACRVAGALIPGADHPGPGADHPGPGGPVPHDDWLIRGSGTAELTGVRGPVRRVSPSPAGRGS